MLNILKKQVVAVAKLLATAFFFTCLLTTLAYITCGKEVEDYITIINKLSVKNDIATAKNISFDSVSKKLTSYPSYGTIWARLSIPKINVSDNLYHGDSLNILKKGIGHYAGSYFPGEGGSIIISAHNSTEHFYYIPTLVEGDKIIIEATYGTYTYEVVSYKIMKKSELEEYEITHNKEELVLYTCYPVDGFSYRTKRYVIFAKLVGDSNA